MPAPAILGPIAIRAVQMGVVALAAYAIARRRNRPLPRERELALNDLDEGFEMDVARREDAIRADAGARWTGAVRLGPNGPGVAVDLTGIGRAMIRRIPPEYR